MTPLTRSDSGADHFCNYGNTRGGRRGPLKSTGNVSWELAAGWRGPPALCGLAGAPGLTKRDDSVLPCHRQCAVHSQGKATFALEACFARIRSKRKARTGGQQITGTQTTNEFKLDLSFARPSFLGQEVMSSAGRAAGSGSFPLRCDLQGTLVTTGRVIKLAGEAR